MPSPRLFLAAVVTGSILTGFALGWFCRSAPLPPPPPSAATASVGSPLARPAPEAAGADAPTSFDDAVANPLTGYRQRLRLAQIASGLDRAGVVAALEHEHARNPLEYRDREWPTEALLARFAEIDPAAATAWLVQTYQGGKLLYDWQSVVMEAWVTRDRKAAVAWVRGLPPGSLRDSFSGSLLVRLAEIDPEVAVRQAARLGTAASYQLTEVFTRLAESGVPAACERALALPPTQAAMAVRGVLSYWAAHQPEDAYAWITQLPAGTMRAQAISQFYQTLESDSPSAAAAWLSAHAGSDLTQQAYGIASAWAAQDLAAARAWSDTLPGPARMQAQSQVVSVWAATDPRAALDYAVSARLTSNRSNAVDSALGTWAKSDPAAALDWVEKAPLGSARQSQQAVNAVCSIWAQQDPRACVDYLIQGPPLAGSKSDPNYALMNAIGQWAWQSPEEVWQWSQGVTDPKVRDSAVQSTLSYLAQSDPVKTSQRVAQLPPESQAAAVDNVASQWAETDPAAAAAWVSTLATADAQKNALATVASRWVSYDAPSALAWTDALPPGASRDAAVQAIINNHASDLDPATSVRLAASLQDPQQREFALNRTVQEWTEQDRPAAEAWIGQAQGLTPAQRARYLGTANGGD